MAVCAFCCHHVVIHSFNFKMNTFNYYTNEKIHTERYIQYSDFEKVLWKLNFEWLAREVHKPPIPYYANKHREFLLEKLHKKLNELKAKRTSKK